MVADTVVGFNVLRSRLSSFLSSSEPMLFVSADTSGSPAPYRSLLTGIQFEKSANPIFVTVDASMAMKVRGSIENLEVWCSHFSFPTDSIEGDHHHPDHVQRRGYLESGSLPVIIEVQNET